MSHAAHRVVSIVGAGPRGLSVLERLCARERMLPLCASLTIHVVDPAEPGAGQVWRTGQSRHLLMNTVASQVTVYTDDSVRIAGPIAPGPSLYEWAEDVAARHDPLPEGEHPLLDEETVREARRLGPDSYPTRAFYGAYLYDSFRRLVRDAPAHVRVVTHRQRAVAVADMLGEPHGPQGLRLEDGTWLTGLDAVVLAQGHVPARLSADQERTAALAHGHRLTYVPPANPADVDLSGVEPGRPVLLRGLGLNFFDYMALFTSGRGGAFRREGSGLVYRPSGREPTLWATSRRGVPYHARGENQKGPYGRYTPRLLTPEYIAALAESQREGGHIDFGTRLWPLISAEVRGMYYETLLRSLGREDEAEAFGEAFLAAADEQARERLLNSSRMDAAHRWDWKRLATPYGDRVFADRDDFARWVLGHLADDVRAARTGNVRDPLKAAVDVLRDLRNEVRLAVDHGGLDGLSYRDELDGWYTPLNAFLSIGPPASRIEEMIALMKAGLLVLTGPGTTIRLDPGGPAFVAVSDTVPGAPVRSSVLIEARLPEPDLRRTGDPLMRYMLDTRQCVPYRIASGHGGSYETGGLAVTERPYRVVDAQGRAHPRRFAHGIPTEGVHWVTAAGIRPGVDSVTLGDSDAIAHAVLGLPPGGRPKPEAAPRSLAGLEPEILGVAV